MSSYSKANLRTDVPDASAGGEREGNIEARFSRKQLEAQETGVSFFRYAPGFRAPMAHFHREQEETYVVVAGSGRIKIGDEIVELRPWDAVRVSPEVVRALEAGDDGLELIIVGGPRPEGGDGERGPEDFWPATV